MLEHPFGTKKLHHMLIIVLLSLLRLHRLRFGLLIVGYLRKQFLISLLVAIQQVFEKLQLFISLIILLTMHQYSHSLSVDVKLWVFLCLFHH
jgi:hypothetical protein